MARKPDPWPKSRPVEVRWLDSMGTSGWQDPKTARTRMECVTVGHLIERTPKSVLVAMNACHYQHGEYVEIPAAAVKRVRRLR